MACPLKPALRIWALHGISLKIRFAEQLDQPGMVQAEEITIEESEIPFVRAALVTAAEQEAAKAQSLEGKWRWADLAGYPSQALPGAEHSTRALQYDIAQQALILYALHGFSGEGTQTIHEGLLLGAGVLASRGVNLDASLSRIEYVY